MGSSRSVVISRFMTSTQTTPQPRRLQQPPSVRLTYPRLGIDTIDSGGCAGPPGRFFFLPFGTFATITALPAHPLVVHAVVVFAPISLVLVLGSVFVKRWRLTLQWASICSLVITSVSSIIAKSSGDSLAAAIGLPEQHARWGNYLVTASLITLGVSVVWVWCGQVGLPRGVTRVLAGFAVIVAVALGGVTYAAGHSGAEAAWAGTFERARAPIASAQESQQPISLEEVALHDSARDCWSVVEGKVYDLTEFIKAPAGAGRLRDVWHRCHPGVHG